MTTVSQDLGLKPS
uniref:Uncharacterized protein n=1 Tax=Anguilla anguilla TaxID=7936 RepID=A0A0E9UIH7_ANGAN